ncbi:MAG: diacylglycerol kinase family protein [Patescibacteria group bacterium]|nr:diacylglycerol kinase family protein [Patescibacteria group bacterium]MDE1988154.1 diacylglycerol kinase family protein [Patescibacteria group bacterium]MDE2217974.1 diacylglycerol kinase family protein [Patescibacteria group bacterium]
MKKFRKSFKAATNGIKETLIFERNFKIMLVMALMIVGLMFYFPTSRTEKAILSTAIFAVLTLEMVNIVIERLLDFVHPGHHEEVRIIKDLIAAIVLIASFGAAVIGLIVFWPYITGVK